MRRVYVLGGGLVGGRRCRVGSLRVATAKTNPSPGGKIFCAAGYFYSRKAAHGPTGFAAAAAILPGARSSLLLGGGLALTSLAPPAYNTYHNARFGYRIDYPADFRPQPEAANGDGRRFVSPDGQTVLSAYAGYNVLDDGLAADRKLTRQGWQQKHATISLDQLTRTG